MATTKSKRSIKDYLPVGIVILVFSLAVYPSIVKTYIPKWAPAEKVIEKETVVEKIIRQTPTVSINTIKVTLVRVIDADTFVADLSLPLSISLKDQHIRCLGYDGVELNDVKGMSAKQELESLFEGGEIFIMIGEDKNSRDNFGRVLAKTYVRKMDKVVSVLDWMKEKGYAKN